MGKVKRTLYARGLSIWAKLLDDTGEITPRYRASLGELLCGLP